MYNQATQIVQKIDYPHYGIFSNDNTYPVTFNPYKNRPPTEIIQRDVARPPHTSERMTKPFCEPPVDLSDARMYLHHATSKPAPVLPPYLNKPQDLGQVQGVCDKRMQEYIQFFPPYPVVQKNIQY